MKQKWLFHYVFFSFSKRLRIIKIIFPVIKNKLETFYPLFLSLFPFFFYLFLSLSVSLPYLNPIFGWVTIRMLINYTLFLKIWNKYQNKTKNQVLIQEVTPFRQILNFLGIFVNYKTKTNNYINIYIYIIVLNL